MLKPLILLTLSNLFVTFAWYGHLKNRMGIRYYNLGQLKIIQEIITMIVFVCFAFFYKRQPLKLD